MGAVSRQPPFLSVLYAILQITIFLPLRYQKSRRKQACEHFGGGNGPPDAVHTEKNRQDQYGCRLENQRPHKRYGRRNRAVVQRRKQGGRKNIKTRQQEGKGKQMKGVSCEHKQLFIITDENARQRRSQNKRQNRQDNARAPHQAHALSEHIF